MRPLILTIAITLALPAGLGARTWTSTGGNTIEAEFVESDGTNVTIKRADGKTFTLPLDKVSGADREFVAAKLKESAASGSKEKAPEITGEITDPGDGEKVAREFTVKGRTRGAPKDHVAILFRSNKAEEGSFFPHYEFSDANRSFSTYLYHGETDAGEWEVHLYVLPEADAEKLVAWVKDVDDKNQAGQQDKIQPYDPGLTARAVHVASGKYYLETN